MPTFRKVASNVVPAPELSCTESSRTYDALLAGFAAGEWGHVELGEGEARTTVRARLQAAAKRRSLALRFRPGPGPMIFCVEQATPSTSLAAASLASKPAPPPPTPEPPAAQPTRAQPRPRAERKAAGRYDNVLPKWMHEGSGGEGGKSAFADGAYYRRCIPTLRG